MSETTFTAGDLQQLYREGAPVRLLDVRTGAEFETAHIPGSYNVPLDALGEHRERIRSEVREQVVLICQSGNRALQAERKLAEIGMRNVHVLRGGIVAWESQGGEVRRGRERWALERQVRLVAGSIVLAAMVGSVVVAGLQWVAAAVGAGLVFAAVSNTCMMGTVLGKLPYNRGGSCDVDAIVAQLADSSAPSGTTDRSLA
jgi:rhodanese-related sulfurtransferase